MEAVTFPLPRHFGWNGVSSYCLAQGVVYEPKMRRSHGVDYDQNAAEYATHRRIHGPVFEELCGRCGLGPKHKVLEVGCGTGNYISALAAKTGCTAYGLDHTAGMLDRARAQPRCGTVTWVQGKGEQLAVGPNTFDLVYSVDLIHHLSDKAVYYREAARTLKPGGWVCTVTDSADMIRRREILSSYFPETVEQELARYPRISQVMDWMAEASLADRDLAVVQEPYAITGAQPFRDRAYSSLHLIPDQAWQAGVERLERDLRQGPIHGASRYACVWGRKLHEG